MSFLQRVALAATVTLSAVGLAIPGSAVQAAELAHAAIAAPSVISLNLPTGDPVPSTDPRLVEAIVAPESADTDSAAVSVEQQPDDTVAYPTLAAAVAAQSTPATDDEQLRCLAGAIYFESKGEPLAGQLAVAEVIMNRAAAGRFGDSLCDVVKQPGQFSFVRAGHIPAVGAAVPAYRTAMAVAKVAMADAWDSGASRALFFHARRVAPGWKKTRVASIGNHVFYR